ncbi:hypothetical protein FRB94_010170 [Tulasnella sp. JGI-2019a]|nr:hypothetical protein FRB93_008879 [Tulasnella sp. JGI-2019a]KAG8994088.1 hypothetical protein FRB94_010170 [Tulasnella sp. JGI-2019a]KAG9035572.1 hypothetical protein FRB95_011116 [Tulasnella sp. JGI-2019a]
MILPAELSHALVQNSGLPLLVFGPDLRLCYYNSIVKRTFTSVPLDERPHATYFFSEEQTQDGAVPKESRPLAIEDVQAKLQKLVDEGQRLALGSNWDSGSKIPIWTGTGEGRKRRWYEGLVQAVLPESGHDGTQAAATPTAPWISVLLKRRLPPSLIPTRSPTIVSSRNPIIHHQTQREKDHGLRKPGSHTLQEHTSPDLEWLQDVMDHIPHICFTTSTTGQVTWVNKQWYSCAGLTPSKGRVVPLQDWMGMHHPDDMPIALEKWKQSLETNTPMKCNEYRLKNKDGDWRWMSAKAEPRRNEHGCITHWVATATDIHEVVQARSEAVKMKEHVRAVLNSAHVALFSVNYNSVVTFFEGSASSALTNLVPVGCVVGRPLVDAWPDPELHAQVTKLLADGAESATIRTEGRYTRGRCYRYHLNRLCNKLESETVIIVAADITDLVMAEATLRKADLERAQLVASETAAREASRLKTAFVTNISHEIRTPIASMIGIAELLLGEQDLSLAQRELVEKSLRTGELLLDLVGMVLDMGKVEAGKLELEQKPFLLAEVLYDAKLFALTAQKKGLQFIEDIPNDLYQCPFVGDRLRLRQILSNLLSNAVKFTAQGSVTLRVREEAGDQPSQLALTFEVADTGVGIEQAILPRLFAPFHQADSSTTREYGGTGLGLFLTNTLVEMMDGKMSLQSEFGKGTTISARVLLPKFKEVLNGVELSCCNAARPKFLAVTSGQPLDSAKPLERSNTRILLADDNALIREVVFKLLTKMEFQVNTVCDGRQAVEAVHKTAYDLILMDGQMPEVDGYEATRLIRRSHDPRIRNTKIIALTASAIRGDRERCLAAGMDGYLAKPVRSKALEEAILEQLSFPPTRRPLLEGQT